MNKKEDLEKMLNACIDSLNSIRKANKEIENKIAEIDNEIEVIINALDMI